MAAVMLTDQQCAGVLKAIGDETRLRILESLLMHEKCVGDLVMELGQSQPHISHHLKILKAAGLVEGLRDGRRICYRICSKVARVMKEQGDRALDFGCCQIRFPKSHLMASVG
jgi:DNA-binding transcriptional ArsR family regulator